MPVRPFCKVIVAHNLQDHIATVEQVPEDCAPDLAGRRNHPGGRCDGEHVSEGIIADCQIFKRLTASGPCPTNRDKIQSRIIAVECEPLDADCFFVGYRGSIRHNGDEHSVPGQNSIAPSGSY